VPALPAAASETITTLQAIILGIVQGLTEFLPVSSTGHLRIVPAVAGWEDPGSAFTAVTQLGTMAAVLVYFRTDLWNMVRAFGGTVSGERPLWRTDDVSGRLGWYLILGTIPIVIVGFALQNVIEDQFRTLELVAAVLILFSLVLHTADTRATQTREVADLRLKDGLILGCWQALALIPGVSRSGSTISGGLFLGLTREAATRFSFLLSVPAVVLSALFELRKAFDGDLQIGPTVIATIFAFISGYLIIAWLLRYVRTHTFTIFVVYRVVVGVIILGLALGGVIS
jgi:undecaprenyl-diphosphatase